MAETTEAIKGGRYRILGCSNGITYERDSRDDLDQAKARMLELLEARAPEPLELWIPDPNAPTNEWTPPLARVKRDTKKVIAEGVER